MLFNKLRGIKKSLKNRFYFFFSKILICRTTERSYTSIIVPNLPWNNNFNITIQSSKVILLQPRIAITTEPIHFSNLVMLNIWFRIAYVFKYWRNFSIESQFKRSCTACVGWFHLNIVLFVREGGDYRMVYYTSPQSFMITISYSLAQLNYLGDFYWILISWYIKLIV